MTLKDMNAQINSTIAETRRFLHHSRVVGRLVESEFYRSYREIFQASTGFPLELHPIDDKEMSSCSGNVNQNRFCSLLNKGNSGCAQCLMAQRCLGDNQDRGAFIATHEAREPDRIEEEHEGGSFIGNAKDDSEDNLGEPIRLDDISHEMHISPFYFYRKFKKVTRKTLTGYSTGHRVELAKERLRN